MARGKKWISSRTPTEHRLYVQALDEEQRIRSANGKSVAVRKPARKPRQNAVQQTPTRKRLYDAERFTQE